MTIAKEFLEKDIKDFLENDIRATLDDMGMWSHAAEKLMFMIAAHESGGFKHRRQVKGSALSFFQIEPMTLYDFYQNYISYRPDRRALLARYTPEDMGRLQALENDNVYACAVTRMQLLRKREALPAADDDKALSEYCKKHWNTASGKATPEKYLADYNLYKPADYE